MAEKRDFPHHMIKEIFEQPQGAARHDCATNLAAGGGRAIERSPHRSR